MILRSVVIAVLVGVGNLSWAQSTIQPRDRLKGDITESDMVRLPGGVHPALARAVSVAKVDATFPMVHMILLLQPDEAQQQALDQLLAQQHDPQSSQFRQFLTPDQYAARFGVSQNDIGKITGWLEQNGFQVEEVTANHLSIVFSGDAQAVESAFKTEVKEYSVNGEVHHANSSDPQIPAALSTVVKGVVKLHDFQTRSFSGGFGSIGKAAQPLYTLSPSTHYMGPADFAMIYDVRPLYTGNLNGYGESIAVVGRSNVKMTDITSFRSQFGLPANEPTVIVAQGSDPGFTNDGDSTEATLDVEWAGAIAPQAQVKFVISSSTSTADGIDLAAMYAVNHNVAPILSVSYGSCEADMGSEAGPTAGSELTFWNSLWQQAAAQGISVFVSAGDSGAAGCDSSSASAGTKRAVNGICSSPYATCVGGTQLNEGSNPGQYWLGGNNAVLGTAQSYIPEVVWNDSAANHGSGLASGGGGVSTQWTKPSWQMGPGVPADGYRDVPDVSLTAASHDGYVIFYNGGLAVVGGTSAAAASLASLFAIINQKYESTQGNVNPVLYALAIKQSQGGPLVFHDITSGNNTVPGVAGYSAGPGYDQASGLGSVDGLQLVNHFHDVSLSGTFTLTATPATVSVQAGQNVTVSAAIAVSSGYNWSVALSASGVPAGLAATFSLPTIPTPGSGTSSLQFAANSSLASGTYPVTITATGGGISKTATVSLTVIAIVPKCTLLATPATVALTLGQATNVRLTCSSPDGALAKTFALTASGQATGVTTSFSPSTLVPGTGTASLTITAGSSAVSGNSTIAVTASGGTFSQTINIPLTLAIPPSFSVALASASLSVVQAASTPVVVTVADIGTFNSATSLSVNGLPAGMTGTFSPALFAAPGAGASTLTLYPSLATPPGKYTINVVVTSNNLVKSTPLAVAVTAAPSFTFAPSASALTIQDGQTTGTVTLLVNNLTGNFSAPVTFSVTGLPTGVTPVFSATTLAAPGSGSSILTFSAATTVAAGQYKLVLAATGGTITRQANLLLTVLGVPGFILKTNVTSLGITAGASFSTTISILSENSFNASVALAVGTLPTGMSATLSNATVASANGVATFTIETTAGMANGTYSVSVSGTSSVVPNALPSQTATIQITVGSVQTTLSTAATTVMLNQSGSVSVTVAAANFTGSETFSVSGLPADVNYSFAPNAITGSGATVLTISVGPSAPAGSYTIYVRTAAGGTSSQSALHLTI